MQPCPGMSRGIECTVPMVPGLVRLIVVPAKSSTVSLPMRALRTTSSYALQNWRKSIASAPLMLGTSSWREPSSLLTSMASPRLTCSGAISIGLPSSSANESFMAGAASSARTTAYPIRWVNETLPPRPRRRWLLMTMRLSISSLAGMSRTLVAVGTTRLLDMFAAVRAAAPRSRLRCPAGGSATCGCGAA